MPHTSKHQRLAVLTAVGILTASLIGLAAGASESLDTLYEKTPPPAKKAGVPSQAAEGRLPPFEPARLAGPADPCTYMELGELGMVQIWTSGDVFYALPYFSPYWVIVATRRDTGTVCDADVLAYREWNGGGTYPDCVSDFLVGSQVSGSFTDFVVGDFNHNPSATTYFQVFCYDGSVGHITNHDAHAEQLVVDGPAVHGEVDRCFFARAWDVYLTGGVEYGFDLDATSSSIRMALFASNGSEYWGGRGDSVWEATGDTLWTAPVSDWYGVVVYADHGDTGSYDVRVGYPCENIALTSGPGTEYPMGAYFEYTQTSPGWNVVGIRSLAGIGEGDLYHFTSWDDEGIHPECVDDLISASERPGDVVDFVVADFNHCPLGTYYPVVPWTGGGSYVIQWGGSGDILETGGEDIETNTVDPSYVATVRDVFLVGGREYHFHFYPEGTPLRLALFGGVPDSPWWSGHSGSVWDVGANTTWMPSHSDYYGLVAYNEAGGTGHFNLSVTYPCEYGVLTDGVTVSGWEGPSYHRFEAAGNRWGVAAAQPTPGSGRVHLKVYRDWNGGDTPNCAGTLAGGSGSHAVSVEYVVADFTHETPDAFYVEVDWVGEESSGEYNVRWEQGTETLVAGTYVSRLVDSDYVAEIWDVVLFEGQEYVFHLETSPGTEDLHVALFNSEGTGCWGFSGEAEWDVTGSTTWTAPATDAYGLLVYNEGGGEGGFVLQIGHPCEFTEMQNGSVYASYEDEFYRLEPTSESWNVLAVTNVGAAGEPSLWVADTWHSDGAHPWCLSGASVGSDLPEPAVDFLVGDYRHNPLAPQHVMVGWCEAPDECGRVTWQGGSGELVVGGDVVERVVNEYYIAEVWDVYLEAGHEYGFYFDPRGTELHMALFGGGDRPLWSDPTQGLWDSIGDIVWTPTESDWYGLVVYNEGGGNGDFTLGTEDTPVEPCFYATLSEPTTVALRWIVSANGAASVDLHRAPSSTGPYVRQNEEPLPLAIAEAYTDAGLWPDTEYWYDLRAVYPDGSEEPVAGSPVSVRTGPATAAALLAVGPNPAAGGTTLRYYVPDSGAPVRLRIVNSRGEVVRTLVDHARDGGGARAVTWDGRSDAGHVVVSGIYFYELAIGSWRHTGKLTVIR